MIKSADGAVTRDVPTIQQFYEPNTDIKKSVSLRIISIFNSSIIHYLLFLFQKGLSSKYVVIGAQNDLCILRPFIEKKIRKCNF